MEKGGGEGELGEGKQRDGGRHGKDGEGGHEHGVGKMVGGTWGCDGEDVGGKQGTDGSAYGEDGDGGWGLGGGKHESAHDKNAGGET